MCARVQGDVIVDVIGGPVAVVVAGVARRQTGLAFFGPSARWISPFPGSEHFNTLKDNSSKHPSYVVNGHLTQ